jgi:hypothetical protein
MSPINPYTSIAKRRLESAIVHLLATEYGMLGGRRILHLLAEDVLRLVEEHYPATTHAQSGSLIWTCTADEGQKAQPGKPAEAYATVTVHLPLISEADLATYTQPPTPSAKPMAVAKARDIQRAVRLVKAAAAQGGLLTIAELSVLLNRSYEKVRTYLREWEDATGELLPLKGYRMDQGSRPTHKKEIVRLFEEGVEAPDIARQTQHSLTSVERYLKDYERVKLLLKRGLATAEISTMINRGPRVVQEYEAIAQQYHPELHSARADTTPVATAQASDA